LKNPTIKIKEHLFTLSSHKTIYWQNKKTLLISDLHLGKGVNAEVTFYEKLIEFENAINEFNINRIIILGDLFDAKSRVDVTPIKYLFSKLNIEIILVLGNHDILGLNTYKELGINIVVDEFKEDMFLFTHKPVKVNEVNIHGHLHPATIYKNVKFPCFSFETNSIGLPAFGGIQCKNILLPGSIRKIYLLQEDSVRQIKFSK